MEEIHLTKKELIKAFRLNFINNLNAKKWKFIAVEICLIIAAFFLHHFLSVSFAPSLLLALFIPILFISVWIGMSCELTRQYKRNPYLSMPKKVSWDNDFIYTHTKFVESKFPWNNFVKIVDHHDLILLYELPNIFGIYPKHAFDSKEEMDVFLRLARQGVAASQISSN